MQLTAAVCAGFVAALLAPWLHRTAGRHAAWILSLVPLALTLHFLTLTPSLSGGVPIREEYAWVPTLSVSLSFRLDGLSLLFALLVTGVGTLVVAYSGPYMASHETPERFGAMLLAFMASMLGLVLADNVYALVVFWELTTLSSFLLIGFKHAERRARRSAWEALMVTAVGGQALLAGLILLAIAGGTGEISALGAEAAAIRGGPFYVPILLLVLGGAFTKSAQVPFHFWLPAAMVAPTPVSAYLHSATMVTAGVYLLARLAPILGGTPPWHGVLIGVGGVTMLVGAAAALAQLDLKKILAYATISVLGMMVLLLGVGTPQAIRAVMVFLIVHAIYKAGLFMVAGTLEHETGTRKVNKLRGLGRALPATATVAALLALIMAGIPPSIGFVGKELALEAAGEASRDPLLAGAVVASKGLLVAVALLAGFRPLLGRRRELPRKPERAPVGMWLGPAALAALGVALGLSATVLGEALIAPAVASVADRSANGPLHSRPRLNATLAWSTASVLLGLAAYRGRGAARWVRLRLRADRWGPARWYRRGERALQHVAHAQTGLLQTGVLRHHLLVILVTLVAAVGYSLLGHGGFDAAAHGPALHLYDLAVAALLVTAAVVAVWARSLLWAVVAVGFVGYGEALVYVLFGAPNPAMVLSLIQTFVTVLLVLVLHRVRDTPPRLQLPARLLNGAVALGVGAVMFTLVRRTADVQLAPAVSSYYLAGSASEAHGLNVVNTVVADFRALDTLGEVTVLSTAIVGVYALVRLRLHRRRAES